MSRILKGLTEAKITDLGPGDEATWPAYSGHPNDPRDPPRRRGRVEPDYDSETYDPWDDHYRRQDAAQKKYKSEVDVQYSDKEGVAPNGKKYNSTFLVKSKTPYQGDNEIYKFNDANWGAKNIVDTEKKNPEKEGDPYLTMVYYVDNHKHGYWKPWKDEPPISKGIQFEAELMHEGISEQDLADVLFHRLELRYPDIVSRHGHEVVGDAVADVASFHAGAEELGTSDISIMIKQVLQHIERRGLDEAQGELDPESALQQARKITSQFKYADMHMDIITKIQLLAEKSGVDRTDLEYLIDDVFEKQRALESAIFSLDEPFEEALRKQQWNDEELDEGWKSTLGGAALAGAMALGGGNAAAGDTNTSGPNMSKPAASWAADSDQWKQSGLPDHVKSDHSITRSSDAQRMSDKRMSSVQGPNASGEYLVTVVNKVNGQRQIQKYVTKNPPKELMVQNEEINEDLRKWFKEKWVRFGPDGKIRGDCARGDDSEGKPKCLPQSKAHSLGKKGRASAAARKRREDPNPERSGAAINVATKKKSNENVTEDLNETNFKQNLYDILQQKYPNVEFSLLDDRVRSNDGKLTVIADEDKEGNYVGIYMWDVATGPYKGALLPAIKKTTEQLLQINPGTKPALFIGGDNQNPEAWEYIAKKLGYKLITDEDEIDETKVAETFYRNPDGSIRVVDHKRESKELNVGDTFEYGFFGTKKGIGTVVKLEGFPGKEFVVGKTMDGKISKFPYRGAMPKNGYYIKKIKSSNIRQSELNEAVDESWINAFKALEANGGEPTLDKPRLFIQQMAIIAKDMGIQPKYTTMKNEWEKVKPFTSLLSQYVDPEGQKFVNYGASIWQALSNAPSMTEIKKYAQQSQSQDVAYQQQQQMSALQHDLTIQQLLRKNELERADSEALTKMDFEARQAIRERQQQLELEAKEKLSQIEIDIRNSREPEEVRKHEFEMARLNHAHEVQVIRVTAEGEMKKAQLEADYQIKIKQLENIDNQQERQNRLDVINTEKYKELARIDAETSAKVKELQAETNAEREKAEIEISSQQAQSDIRIREEFMNEFKPIWANLVQRASEAGRTIGQNINAVMAALSRMGKPTMPQANKINELKCWDGYKRVPGTKAGAPGSCKKKTSEDQAPMFTPESKCPHCGGPMFEAMLMNEKKDACYYKVKSRYKVWPSAYASGALVKCRKKGADSWGTGGKKNEGMVMGASSDASSAGTRVQGEAANPAQQAAIAIAMKKAGQKPKRESAIMKGLVDETLGTPYPGTYEQETSMIKRKGPERITAMTYENKEGRKK